MAEELWFYRGESVRATHVRRIVSEHFHLTSEEICSDSRKAKYVMPRQVAMYFSFRMTDLSLTQIAEFYGRKDHTTVSHAVKKIMNLIETNEFFRSAIEKLETKIIGCNLSLEEMKEAYKLLGKEKA